jgi:hypothetical protein
MTWRVGVDSGGTFANVCLLDEGSGRDEVWKVRSTPDDPSLGIASGVLCAMGLLPTDFAPISPPRGLLRSPLPHCPVLLTRSNAGGARSESRASSICVSSDRITNCRSRCRKGRSGRRHWRGQRLHRAHQQIYGFVTEGEPVQLVTYRVEASEVIPKAAIKPRPLAAADASRAINGGREVWLPEEGRFVCCRSMTVSSWRQGTEFGAGNRRTDGRNDTGAARHGGAGRPVSEPDTANGMSRVTKKHTTRSYLTHRRAGERTQPPGDDAGWPPLTGSRRQA